MEASATPFISRRQQFPVVASTNDVVRDWLADGTPEVCLAVADEQTQGRGRAGRTWQAPRGAALLMSLGFRPTWLEPDRTWRLAAVVSLAMAEAAEAVAGLEVGTITLKWPNDLIILGPMASRRSALDLGEGEPTRQGGWQIRKLAGVLGETDGLGGPDPRVVVGIGTNVDWAARDFPSEISDGMTSLRELAGGRSLRGDELLEVFLEVLAGRIARLRSGLFDAEEWQRRQLTSDLPVRLELPNGGNQIVTARGVDPATGGLVVEVDGQSRTITAGEIHHLRLAERAPQGREPLVEV